MATVAEVRGTTVEEIAMGRGGDDRMLVAYLARSEGLIRLGELAAGLNLRSEGAVSALAARCERSMTT